MKLAHADGNNIMGKSIQGPTIGININIVMSPPITKQENT